MYNLSSLDSLHSLDSINSLDSLDSFDSLDSLSAALRFLAGDVCLQIGKDTLAKCRPLSLTCTSAIAEEALCTWLCKDAHFFTLFKSEDNNNTLIYSHTNEMLYHASVDAQLAPICPKDMAFLCQFTFDSLPEGRVPRLLVFDVLFPGPAVHRGEILRSMQCLPQPLCCVQWLGFSRYLSQEFFQALPHAISGILVLGDDPLQMGVMNK